jgi:hypothetical protein
MPTARGRIEIDSAVAGADQLQSASTTTSQFEQNMGGLAKSFTVAALASQAVTRALGAIKDAFDRVLEVALNWEDWVGDQSEALDTLSDSLGGMASKLDLSRLQAQASGTALAGNEKAMRGVGVAARLLSRRLHIDLRTAYKQVSDAVIKGSRADTIFRQLGHDIEFTGGKVAQTASAIALLEREYGDLTVEAINTNEQLERISANLDNAIGELTSAATETEAFKTTMDDFGKSTQSAAEAIAAFNRAGLGAGIQKWAEGMTSATRQINFAAQQAGFKGAKDFFSFIGQASLAGIERISEPERAGFVSQFETTLGGGRGFEFGTSTEALLRGQSKRKRRGRGKGRPPGERGPRGFGFLEADIQQAAGVGLAGFETGLGAAAVFAGAAGRAAGEAGPPPGISAARQEIDALQDAATRAVGSIDMMDSAIQAANDNMEMMAVGGLANLAAGVWSAVDAAIQGEQSFGRAMASITKGVLFGVAQEATVKAIFHAAAGWGALGSFGVTGNPAAHFAAAKMYGIAAITAGAAGAAVSAGLAGGGSAGAEAEEPARARARGAGTTFRPSSGRQRPGDQQFKPTINIFLDAKDAATRIAWRKKIASEVETVLDQGGRLAA